MMVLSTATRPVNGNSGAAKPLSVLAIRFRQKRPDVNLYVTALPVKDLLGRLSSDTYRSDNPAGYQRPVTPSRVRQLSSYLRAEEGMLPTSIVLCIRQPYRAQFEAAGLETGGGESGLLTISADVALWV